MHHNVVGHKTTYIQLMTKCDNNIQLYQPLTMHCYFTTNSVTALNGFK